MRDGARGGAEDRAEAASLFREGVDRIFGGSCKAAWLSGSFLYHGAKPGRSDIDVVIVLDDRTAIPAGSDTLDRVRAFVDIYLDVHARFGLDPDLDFPAEYVVQASIEQAIEWRGLSLEGEVARQFPPVEHKDYWLGRPDRWFNAWLSETAFSRFLTGDEAYHERSKLAAWKTIFRFLLLRSDDRRGMTLEDFWPGLAHFGVKESYRPFWPVERKWVDRALSELEAEGAAQRIGDEVLPVRPALIEWESRIRTAIAADRGDGPLLLPVSLHDEIADYAKARWARMSEADARLATAE